MKTCDIINLDYGVKENREIIQKALKRIKPFSNYENEVEMSKIEKFIGVAIKKYDLFVKDISFTGIVTEDNKYLYSLHLLRESDISYFETIYGYELYELIAKAAIYVYTLIKQEKVRKRDEV